MFSSPSRHLVPPPAASTWLALVIALGTLLVGTQLVALNARHAAYSEARLAAEQAASVGIRGTRQAAAYKCDTCGVVESIHRSEPSGITPVSYEFTVRLRDRTTRVSSVAGPGHWQVGDRIQLIGSYAAVPD